MDMLFKSLRIYILKVCFFDLRVRGVSAVVETGTENMSLGSWNPNFFLRWYSRYWTKECHRNTRKLR